MKRLIIVAGLTLVLGGCLPSLKNPVSVNEVYALENAYGLVQTAAVTYVRFPLCPKGTSIGNSIKQTCSLGEARRALDSADRSARMALKAAEDFVRKTPTLDAVSVITTAKNAIAAFSAIEAIYGVKS